MTKKPLDLFLPSKAPSHRQKRVAQEIRFCLSTIFLRNEWPVRFDENGDYLKPPALITITDVTLSADLKQATVWVMPLGGEFQSETKLFLESVGGYLRKQISSHLQLRGVPTLKFDIDPSFGKMAQIDKVLKTLSDKSEE
ncbi:ribosome-binding factor A [Candidatus Finniella inopinata]|uniref:Ribosome-binding factor A n=1 Tax=Candidatus Finniella inopinata TaxID=1696036 RepID=A0A4Q7DG25_9PROT|nr:ribosome-binding factor A [Candidatus Finniella inopinata]RZI45733.1 ribosome-binding factor A [Candidatus Finniella inopinata]